MFHKLRKLAIASLIFSAVSVFATQAAAAQQAPSIHVNPSAVLSGSSVEVYGNAGACSVGDQVTLISPAFSASRTALARSRGSSRRS
jgi:hypothetical protein